MRKAIAICLTSIIICGIFAADMTGQYNTWLGYIAGINADGNRTTVQGAGAGGEASGLVRTDLVGAAAGAYATNLTDCVGIGFRSLLYAADMQSVVAIGTDALTNRKGLAKATWINGQFGAFGQNDSFWIKANPNQADTNAPIHYANGVLSLNADTVRINGETAGGGGGGGGEVSAPILTGYDLYVDPVNGDDAFSGTSPGAAKRTIDGAYVTINRHGMRICLLPGEHLASTNMSYQKEDRVDGKVPQRGDPPYRYEMHAPYGPTKTSIVTKGRQRQLTSREDGVSYVSGCEIGDFIGYTWKISPFFNVVFSNCVFKGDMKVTTSTETCGLFIGCTLNDCRIEGRCYPSAIDWEEDFYDGMYSAVFLGCVLNNTVITPVWMNKTWLFSCESTFYNCFLDVGTVDYVDGGYVSSFTDTTLISTNCTKFSWRGVHSPFYACLAGLNDSESIVFPQNQTACVITNAATIISRISEGYRPKPSDWAFRFAGYESHYERMNRDAMFNSVKSILAGDTTVNLSEQTRAALMLSVSENEEVQNAMPLPPGEAAPKPRKEGVEEE